VVAKADSGGVLKAPDYHVGMRGNKHKLFADFHLDLDQNLLWL
jgi:hypothetical protein